MHLQSQLLMFELPSTYSAQTNDPAGFTVVDVMAWGAQGHAGALRAVAMRCDACHVGQLAVLLQCFPCTYALNCASPCCSRVLHPGHLQPGPGPQPLLNSMQQQPALAGW